LTLNFWGIYEMGFSEGPHVKAPRDLEIPFGAFFIAFLYLNHYQTIPEVRSGLAKYFFTANRESMKPWIIDLLMNIMSKIG
jgi:hypothetical protein